MKVNNEKSWMGRRVQGALFDLDGVLAFTDRYHYLAWKRLADEQGWAFDERMNLMCRGVPRRVSLQVILDANAVVCSENEKMRLEDLKNGYYLESLSDLTDADIYPGAVEFLVRLKAEGLKLAICSSSRNAEAVLRVLDLNRYFDVVIGGDAVGRPKPAPDIFLLGAQQLNLSPDECVVFEDAESGVIAARAAGMVCVGVGKGAHLKRAHLCITNYSSPDLVRL